MAREFRDELKELITLKADFQTKFAEIDNLDKKYRARFRQLRKTNIEQDKRLELLEIQEKVHSFIRNQDYIQALKVIGDGLVRYPHDQTLSRLESYSLFKLKLYDDAINSAKKYLEEFPMDIGTVANLAESYLILEKIPDYEEFIKQNRELLINRYGIIIWYFEAIKFYLIDDINKLREHILSRLDKDSVRLNINKIDGWEYDDIRSAIYQKVDTRIRSLIIKFIDYLEGNISGQELASFIHEIA